MRTGRRTISPLRSTMALLAGLVAVLAATPAYAHGGGDSEEAQVLVVDALSYLANQPDGYMDAVTDKIGDALEAPDTEGVDLTKVQAAQDALEAGDMAQVRTLLQASLEPMSGPVTGEETGTTTMPDPMSGRTTWGTGNVVLAILSGLAVLAGLLLAWLWRPPVTLHDLRTGLDRGGTR